MESRRAARAIDIVVPPYMSMGVVLPPAGRRAHAARAGPVDRLRGHRRQPPAGTRLRERGVGARGLDRRARDRTRRSPRSGACPTFVRAQDERRWAPEFSESLADRRVLLLGYGGRRQGGRRAPGAVRGRAHRVVASRARFEDGMPVHGVERLPELLPARRDRHRHAARRRRDAPPHRRCGPRRRFPTARSS